MKSIKFYIQSKTINEELSIIATRKVIDGVSTEFTKEVLTAEVKNEILNVLVYNLRRIDTNSRIKIYFSSSYLSRNNRFRNVDSRNKSYQDFMFILTSDKYDIKLLPIDGTGFEKQVLELIN